MKAVQMEDEIAGVCSAIGASYAGHLAVTSTSGPGLALKSEGIGLAVMAELPARGDRRAARRSLGRSSRKTEQTDLLQALFGRNGGVAALRPRGSQPYRACFQMAFEAARIAMGT